MLDVPSNPSPSPCAEPPLNAVHSLSSSDILIKKLYLQMEEALQWSQDDAPRNKRKAEAKVPAMTPHKKRKIIPKAEAKKPTAVVALEHPQK